jgi:hypothetical protein
MIISSLPCIFHICATKHHFPPNTITSIERYILKLVYMHNLMSIGDRLFDLTHFMPIGDALCDLVYVPKLQRL